MRSYELLPKPNIEDYHLPEGVWQSIDDVPEDFKRIVQLNNMAQSPARSIEEARLLPATLEDIYGAYDDWSTGQEILVARDENGKVIGMLDYYYKPNGKAFVEAVAVHPDAQQGGIGAKLISAALNKLYVKAKLM